MARNGPETFFFFKHVINAFDPKYVYKAFRGRVPKRPETFRKRFGNVSNTCFRVGPRVARAGGPRGAAWGPACGTPKRLENVSGTFRERFGPSVGGPQNTPIEKHKRPSYLYHYSVVLVLAPLPVRPTPPNPCFDPKLPGIPPRQPICSQEKSR